MKDLGLGKLSYAFLVWGIFSWGFLIHKIWVSKFRSRIFGHRNPVRENRFELVEGSGRWVDLSQEHGELATWFKN